MSADRSSPRSSTGKIAELRVRLAEAEDMLHGIRSGEVEALLVNGPDGPQVFSLNSADAASNRLRGEILAQVSDAVIAVDNEQRVIFFNNAAERQYGVRSSESLGRELGEIYTRPWPNPEEEAATWAALRELGEWRGDSIHRTRDGREIHVESRLALLRDSHGAETGMIAAIRDITDRVRQEEELRLWKDELEVRVQERTKELLASQGCLRALATELNRSEQRERKRVAGELHDHLAQWLVLCRLKLGQMKRVGLPPNADEILNETDEVLTQALDYSRTLMAELSPSVLQEHGLPAGLTWLGAQMQRHGLAVTVDVGQAADCVISEDGAMLLFQSVRELLMNVLKHAGSPKVAVRLAHHEGRLRIEVRDEGVGFDFAAAGTTTMTDLSSQFGLFSIRERMRALGGLLDLVSAPGQGTTVTLVLPLRDAQSSGTRQEAREKQEQSRSDLPLAASPLRLGSPRIRVLLVDDHAMVRQGLRSVLESYSDVEVVGEAVDGEEAVAFAAQLQPSIVVMDINMPKMNGIKATAEITSRYPGIIVIGLSVNTGDATEEAIRQAGAVRLLDKGAAVEELYRTIQEVLGAKGITENGS